MFYPSHLTGTQTLGGVNVTVTNLQSQNGPPSCSMGPYGMSQAVGGRGWKFEFSKPVSAEIALGGMDDGEIIRVFVNGNQYLISQGEISSVLPATCLQVNGTAIAGDYVMSGAGVHTLLSGKMNIRVPGGIDSLRVIHVNGIIGGSIFRLGFEVDTSVRIKQPFIDTAFCPGDSFKVHFNVNNNFNSGNTFSAQLSNASGSFASPVVIGTKTATSDDSIACQIPRGMTPGNGYRIRIVASNPARLSPDNAVNIRVKPFPNVSVSNNTPVCIGDTVRLVGSSTNTGVTFSWTGPNGFSSFQKDTFIANATTQVTGLYKLTAKLEGCVASDSDTISLKPLPGKPVTNNNSPLCEQGMLNLFSLSSTPGVSYQWDGPNGYTSTAANTSRPNATPAMSGDYISTVTLNGCIARDTTTAIIHPTPAAPTAGNNNPVCVGGDIKLNASAVAGASYEWTGPKTFYSTDQNPVKANAELNDGGTYSVLVKVNGCPSPSVTTLVSVIQGPSVLIYLNPGDSLCPGWDVSMVALPQNAGSNPAYEWFKNSTSIGTGPNYKETNIIDGDSFFVRMTAGTVCNTPINSKAIRVTVLPVHTPPTITIMADPGPHAWPGVEVKFKAKTGNSGLHPGYQWIRNGVDVSKATDSVWTAGGLKTGDTICCRVTSNFLCAAPREAVGCLVMNMNAAIEETNWAKSVGIYPNPVTDKLIVENAAKADFEITDVLGKKIMTGTLGSSHDEIDFSKVAEGVYFIRLSNATGEILTRRLLKD